MKKIALLVGAVLFLTACTVEYNDPKPPRAFKGGENATVIVREYGDFQCPACGTAYDQLKDLPTKYGDKVRWEFYHFPLTSIHPYAYNASLAAECANDQGKFWDYHDTLFENQAELTRKDLYAYAELVGLDADLFDACFRSKAKASVVRGDMQDGNAMEINSTPTFYVNDEELENWTRLEVVLDAAVATTTPEN